MAQKVARNYDAYTGMVRELEGNGYLQSGRLITCAMDTKTPADLVLRFDSGVDFRAHALEIEPVFMAQGILASLAGDDMVLREKAANLASFIIEIPLAEAGAGCAADTELVDWCDQVDTQLGWRIVPALIECLESNNGLLRYYATYAIGYHAAKFADRRTQYEHRDRALGALRKIERSEDAVVDSDVVRAAIDAVCALEPARFGA